MNPTQLKSICLNLVIIGSFFFKAAIDVHGQTNISDTNPEYSEILTNAPPRGYATRLDYLKSFSSSQAVIKAYHSGLINNGEAMIALEAQGDKASMDTYGKVVDQNGQPIPDVKVRGNVEISGDFFSHFTTTDAHGRFNFTGLHGTALFITLQKEGYEYNSRLLPERPKNYLPDTNDPLIFEMWKPQGAEKMIHKEFQLRVPYDGTPKILNLETENGITNCSLKITLDRNPQDIRGFGTYNWKAKIEIVGGDLQPENTPYPFLAPEQGYQPVFETNMNSNTVPWSYELKQNFFFKNEANQYGRLFVDLSTRSRRPDAGVSIETWLNPSGSRNLEFDPQK